ncbi:MAG: hypothetical protein JWQ40_4494 [Segetibacter sp.]|nr:hypothetical protein [Segetibacter sp.]
MKKETEFSLSRNSRDKFNCKTPVLFAIPVNEYTGEKERDKGWYLKMQQLEKKSFLLRQEFQLLCKTQLERVEKTQQIVAFSYAVNERFIKRSAG